MNGVEQIPRLAVVVNADGDVERVLVAVSIV